MQTERRCASRHGLNSIVYLELGSDNGGILLDLSEQGMQISVANRLVTASEVRFTLRAPAGEQVHGTGRVAWLSPSGRSAGVHFLDLPDSVRREIARLLGTEAAPAPAEPDAATREAEPARLASVALSSSDIGTPSTEHVVSQAAEPSSTPPASTRAPDPPEAPISDPLELLKSAAEPASPELAEPAWTPPSVASAPAPSASDDDPPPSLLALYGIDGRETGAAERPLPSTEPPMAPPRDVARSTDWSADRSPVDFGHSGESKRPDSPFRQERGSRPRKMRPRVRRKHAVEHHPPILLSPIFVPAPPAYETLDLPEPSPDSVYVPPATPPESAPQQPAPPEPPAAQAAEEPTRLPGALYLPNYRVDRLPTPEPREPARRGLLSKPFIAFDMIFERFEEFGRSLESDWHVWLGLILLVAGFLSLTRNPPLIVLTVAFWFASAVLLTERRRPSQNGRGPHGS